MAARSLPTWAERLVTILIAPLMTCAARLPVYTMVTAAVFAGSAPVLGGLSLGGLVIAGMYLFGVLMAVAVGLILRRFVAPGSSSALLLELPRYRWPRPTDVARVVWRRMATFVTGTGPVIVALTVLLWALMTFPRVELPAERAAELQAAIDAATTADARQEAAAALERAEAQHALLHSAAGRIGHAIEPAIAPLGFDWRIGIGLIGSFAAREVMVPVMAQVYGRSEALEDDALGDEVGHTMVRVSGLTPLVGVSLMVFFAIALQCLSTVAAIARETRSWRWPAFALLYLNGLAYLCSLAVFQIGSALGLGGAG
jgi:ferrous iron transport protein B